MNGNYLCKYGWVEGPAICTWIANNDIVILINTDDGAALSEALVHPLCPAAMAML